MQKVENILEGEDEDSEAAANFHKDQVTQDDDELKKLARLM